MYSGYNPINAERPLGLHIVPSSPIAVQIELRNIFKYY